MSDKLQERIYILEGLGCANCAAKMEAKIRDLPEVTSATLTFATKQLKIEASDPDVLTPRIQSICTAIEDTVTVVEKPAAKAAAADGEKGFLKQHGAAFWPIVVGAVLFAVGLVFEHIWGYDMWFAGGGRIVLITFGIFLLAYLLMGHRVLLTAGKNILHGQVFDEHFLMSIATIAAFCIGEFAEGAGVMLFYRIGEFFEHVAVEKSRTQIMEAVDLRPETVALVTHEDAEAEGDNEKGAACADACGCKTAHHEDACGCGCEPAYHEDACGCGCETAHHEDTCGCGCELEHDLHLEDCGCVPAHHEDTCGCGCDAHEHDHEEVSLCACERESNVHYDCGCGHDYGHPVHSSRDVIMPENICIIPAEDAKPGDVLLVRPGDRIPLDGVVIEGESRIDTSPVTGEPVPVSAQPGTEVISGCVNVHGVLKVRVTRPLSESMVTRILDSVENAAAGKPKIDKFITRFARVYTPIVVALAVLTAVIPSLFTGQWSFWITTAITFLVISCPCALVISVPLAFFSGIGAASKLGILFKGGLAMEALKNIKAVIMDKTGTITKGVFAVDRIIPFGDASEEDVLAVAAACEAASSHPVAVSIMEKAAGMSLSEARADVKTTLCMDPTDTGAPLSLRTPLSITELAGMGIRATFAIGAESGEATRTALCGNRKLMALHHITLPELTTFSGTEILVALDGRLLGQITISDQLKDDSVSAIGHLKALGLIPAMLTGDNMESAAAVAAAGGIEKIRAGLLPEDKVTALTELRDELGAVMFVGDGINDAPVLAGADVGAAMGSGADAAIEAADVVFMKSSLESVPKSVAIARYTSRIAMQNIVFALAVKLLVILLGFAGFANIWAAVFADTGVAILCILNSLRVLWRKY